MLNTIVDTLTVTGYSNFGVNFVRNNKSGNPEYFNHLTQEEIGINDSFENYFFAINEDVTTELDSCYMTVIRQIFTLKFVTKAPSALYIFDKLSKGTITDSTNINSVKFKIVGPSNEESINKNLFVNTFKIEVWGVKNTCEVEVPCKC